MKLKIASFLKNNYTLKFISNFIKKSVSDDIFGLTAGLTFYLIMAFFPFMILLLALVSITPLSAEETLFSLLSNFPKEVYDIVFYILTGVSRSSAIILSSGIIAMWSISCAVSTLIKAFNKMYGITENRNFITIRSIGFIFAILLAVVILLTFILLIMGNVIGYAIYQIFPQLDILWHVLRLLIVTSVLLSTLVFIYKMLPSKKLGFSSAIWGAILTSILWCGSSTIFSFYVNNFSNYHIIYGSLAGIVVLITWLYMSSMILLLGGELNSIIYSNKNNKTPPV